MDINILGVLEFNSIAIGIKALDGMIKSAPIKIIDARTVCPGKFLIIFSGDVAAVDSSLTAGKEIGEGYVVDELFIPNLHSQVIPAIIGTIECKVWDAIGVIESFSVIASIEAADIAAKTADILLVEVKLAAGLGGKSFIKIIGDIYKVKASIEAAIKIVSNKGLLCNHIIIPNPHPDIKPYFLD